MKLALFLFLLLISKYAFSAIESSKIYYSFDTEKEATLFIVPGEKEDTYYLNYVGFEHRFDGKTLLYEKLNNHTGNGYYLKLVGMPNVNFRNDNNQTIISGTLISYSNVYLDDNSITKIVYSGTTDKAKASRVIQQYKKRQFETFSKVEAKKLYKKHLASLIDNCRADLDINIDWSRFENMGIKSAPSKLSAYLQSLEQICKIDSDYAIAIKSIKKIIVIPSQIPTSHSAKLQGSELTIKIGFKVENITETSYKLMYDIF